jgi:hypothetical protein
MMLSTHTTLITVIVRESCYPFYEPCNTELSNGCSQEVQSFKRR